MTLSRRVVLLLAALLLLALAGSLVVHTWAARQALQQQLSLRNTDAAASLALALSQQEGDPVSLQTVAAAHFDLGGYRLVRLAPAAGAPLIDLQRTDVVAASVPAWFVKVFPIGAEPGQAKVSHGWQELGTLEVAAQSAWAINTLWQACWQTALLLLLLGLLAGAVTMVAFRAWHRPLQATVAQAQALEQGRFLEAPEPRLPELKRLTRSMNSMVRRLREVFSQQAQQLQKLQHEAMVDAVSGLPLRRQFLQGLARLRHEQLVDDEASAGDGPAPQAAPGSAAEHRPATAAQPGATMAATAQGPGLALILLRVQGLDELNQRLGRAPVDQLLATVGSCVAPYLERVPGSFAGRMNGSDFALCLPVLGVAADTAQSLHQALAAAPAVGGAGAQVAVGAVDVPASVSASAALAHADAALARAEDGLGWYAADHDAPAAAALSEPGGARVWRHQIAQALAEGRAALGEFVVLSRDRQLLHLECPLRVQMVPGQDYQAATQWLALARRSRLMPQVDLKALELALQAIAEDGRPRAVHVSWPSLAAPGFAAECTRRLQLAPQAAGRLSIEWIEGARPRDWLTLAAVTQDWRALGVRIGAEHAGAHPQQLVELQDLGVDYVKVDARHLRGLASDPAVFAYVKALVQLIHGLSAQALAEGVSDGAELEALWKLGFDAATGPAVTRFGKDVAAPAVGAAFSGRVSGAAAAAAGRPGGAATVGKSSSKAHLV